MSSIYPSFNKIIDTDSLSSKSLIKTEKNTAVQNLIIQESFSNLNEMVFTNNQERIRDLVPLIKKNSLVQEHLFNLIERSKRDEAIATAAANAITLLVATGINLSSRDFRGIRVPYADLSNGILTNTDLSDSDLSHVRLFNIRLDFSKLNNSQLNGIELDEPLAHDEFYSSFDKKLQDLDRFDALYITPNGKKIFLYNRGDHDFFEKCNYSCLDANTGILLENKSNAHFGGTRSPRWIFKNDSIFNSSNGEEVFFFRKFPEKKIKTIFIDEKYLYGNEHLSIKYFDFSKNGEWLLSSNSINNQVSMCKTSTKKIELSLSHKHKIEKIALSPDGKWAFTMVYNSNVSNIALRVLFNSPYIRYTASLWDCDIEKKRTTFDFGLGKKVFCMEGEEKILSVFSSDSRWFLSVASGARNCYQKLTLWNCESRKTEIVIETYMKKGRYSDVAFSPDNQWFCVCYSNGLALYQCKDRKDITLPIQLPIPGLSCAKFSPNGEWILSGSDDGSIKLWDWKKKKELLSFNLYDYIREVEFFPDGCHILIKTNLASLQKWQLFDDQNQLKPALIWSNSPLSFSAINLQLDGAKNLTDTHKKIFKQWGALFSDDARIFQTANKVMALVTNLNRAEEDVKELFIPSFDTGNNHNPLISSPTNSPSAPQINEMIDFAQPPPSYQAATTGKIAQTYMNQNKSIGDLQKEIDALSAKLGNFNGNVPELQLMISDKQKALAIEKEQQTIFADGTLSDYYYVFYTQFTDIWFASKAIHSEMIKNDTKKKIDYLPALLNRGAEYVSIPGIALLTDILTFGINTWSDHDKKTRINRLVNYFGTISSTDVFIESFTRQLTLAKASKIKALMVQKKGVFQKLVAGVVNYKNKITANDLDTAIKECAADDAKTVLTAIMDGKLTAHPSPDLIPTIIESLFGLSTLASSPIVDTMTTITPNLVMVHNETIAPMRFTPNINQVSAISEKSLSPTSPLTYEQLLQKVEQLGEKVTKQDTELQTLQMLNKNQKSQSTRDHDIQEALKEIDKIKTIFSGSQILMPEPGHDTKSFAILLGQLSKQMDLITTKVAQIEDKTGQSFYLTKPSKAQQEKAKKIREELYSSDSR